MKSFEILFELFGKKLKTTIEADSISHAKSIIKEKIIFHKITEVDDDQDIKDFIGSDATLNNLKDILGIK